MMFKELEWHETRNSIDAVTSVLTELKVSIKDKKPV